MTQRPEDIRDSQGEPILDQDGRHVRPDEIYRAVFNMARTLHRLGKPCAGCGQTVPLKPSGVCDACIKKLKYGRFGLP